MSKNKVSVHLLRLDPRGEYIKRYIPELRNMPEKYIHQPWLCPIEIQQKNNIIVGETYPFPMLDLAQATILNSIRMKSIRESIISKPHVRPSNENEIRNFFWIADDVMTKCN